MIYVSFDIGVKNLAVCILKRENDDLSIIDWNIICLSEKKKDLKGIKNIADVVYKELDDIIGTLHAIEIDYIDKVIIENQPSNLNGIMKIIQLLIYSYFDLIRHWKKNVGEVILINASVKLQNHDFIPSSGNSVVKKMSKNEKYKLNKKNGIEVCRHYIKNDMNLLNFFDSHKKKDDLADTCIQTISYLRKYGNKIENVSLNNINFFIETRHVSIDNTL